MSKNKDSVDSRDNPTTGTSLGQITVVIAGQPAVLRDELERLVRIEPGLHLLRIAGNAHDTITALETSDPDVLILDLEMDGSSDAVRRKAKRTSLLLLTASGNRKQLAEAMKLGCSGIARKHTAPKLIVKSIWTMHAGEAWLDQQTAAAMLDFTMPQQYNRERHVDPHILSPREYQIVELISQGYKNPGIADQMGISLQTVKNHVRSVFAKLGVSDRLDLALFAVEKGWYLNPRPAIRSKKP